MTDDISKVVRRFRGTGEPERDGYIPAGSAIERDRPKSAAAPAEVGEPALRLQQDVVNRFGSSRILAGDYYTADQYATLARQLAEAKAVLVSLLTEREHRTDGDLPTLADRCRHLSRGDRDVIQMRGSLIETYKTRAEQAESQLAEATRRLGEVEALLAESLPIIEQFEKLCAALGLTKEPTK